MAASPLPTEARRLLREVQGHKREIKANRKAAAEKVREVERICRQLGIKYTRRVRNGTAQGHSQDSGDGTTTRP